LIRPIQPALGNGQQYIDIAPLCVTPGGFGLVIPIIRRSICCALMLTAEELWESEGISERGEFDPPPPCKKRKNTPDNLRLEC
jgi:hypothetical protein